MNVLRAMMAVLLVASCSSPSSTPDGGVDAGEVDATSDAGEGDAAAEDAGVDAFVSCAERCEDAECVDDPVCLPPEETREMCLDGLDNDEDDLIDCRDPGCRDSAHDVCGVENTEARCFDGIDNDNDGSVDCADTSCRVIPRCVEGGAACTDTIDNDLDGDTDCEDFDCREAEACGMPVRVVAANLTSGGAQTYDGGHGLRILEGISPDIVLIQELNFRDNTPAAFEDLATLACGGPCEIFRGRGTSIPNGVVSRFPILDAGDFEDPETDTREFTWARLDVPGDVDLWAVSVHWLTSSGASREREAIALVAAIEATVPDGDFLIVAGDFNANGGPSFDRLSALVNTFSNPGDQMGNTRTNGPRTRTIDSVFVNAGLEPLEIPVRIGTGAYDGGFVVDTRVYTPISDLAPALVDDSGAEGMQHMAVLRDFILPLE
ncbi:MAG: endonuclease/exonuclease/phosphatase family protein [Myxococcota bacterium]